jgi:hypothetical protein
MTKEPMKLLPIQIQIVGLVIFTATNEQVIYERILRGGE